MIFWAVLEIFAIAAFGLLISMEVVNGSTEARFIVIFILAFIIILVPIFTIGAYVQSITFYNDFMAFADRMRNINPAYEFSYFGTVINYNERLYKYQDTIKIMGFTAPYYSGVKMLTPIQLENFDTDVGRHFYDN